MLRTATLALGLVIASGLSAFGQVKLDRKIPEGATLTVESTSRIEQKLTIAGMDTETASDTKSVVKAVSGKRDAAGMLRVEEKPESMQISTTVMGQNYFFDSANPDTAGSSALEVLRPLHKALSRSTTVKNYDKDNRLQTIEQDQNALNTVSEEVQKLVKSQLDPEYQKKTANQDLEKFPTDPVKKGDSWQRTETVNFGAGQVMTFQSRYTYEGTVEKDGKTLDKVTQKVESVDYTLQDSPLPFTVKGSQLKAAESDTTMLLDRKLGAIVDSKSALRITGEITFVIGGNDVPAKLDLKIESTAVLK